MTPDVNLLLEQYNFAQLNDEDGFDDEYWNVAEWIGQTLFSNGTINEHGIIDLLIDLLELSEDDLNLENLDDFMEELDEVISNN